MTEGPYMAPREAVGAAEHVQRTKAASYPRPLPVPMTLEDDARRVARAFRRGLGAGVLAVLGFVPVGDLYGQLRGRQP